MTNAIINAQNALIDAAPAGMKAQGVDVLDRVVDVHANGVLVERAIQLVPVVAGRVLMCRLTVVVTLRLESARNRTFFMVTGGAPMVGFSPMAEMSLPDLADSVLEAELTGEYTEAFWKQAQRQHTMNEREKKDREEKGLRAQIAKLPVQELHEVKEENNNG